MGLLKQENKKKSRQNSLMGEKTPEKWTSKNFGEIFPLEK